MAFQNSFNGKDTSVQLPSSDGLLKSQEGMNNMLMQAEQLKYNVYRKNAEEFQKASNIDPVFVLADSAQKTQMGLISAFNQKYGKLYQQYGGNLPDSVKMQMTTDRNLVIMQQQKMQSEMEAAQTQNKMVAQNPNRWDVTEQAQRYNDYIQTGNYNYQEPPIKPLSLTDAAMKNMNKVSAKEYHLPEEDKTYTKNGVNYIDRTTYSAGKEDVAPYIKSAIANDDQYAAGALKEWNELGQADKEKYHNSDPTNPILGMAIDRHWKEWVKQDVKTERNMVGGTSSGNMRTWQGNKYTPTSAMESPFPSMPSNTYHPIPNVSKQITIPISKMELLEPDKAVSGIEKPNQSIKGFVTGYDENSDKITFLISQDYKDLDYPTLASGKGMQIAVPRSSFSKEIFDDLEIMKDGKLTKLKDVVAPKTGPVANSWDKYKRK
jgi:hypothetical protein